MVFIYFEICQNILIPFSIMWNYIIFVEGYRKRNAYCLPWVVNNLVQLAHHFSFLVHKLCWYVLKCYQNWGSRVAGQLPRHRLTDNSFRLAYGNQISVMFVNVCVVCFLRWNGIEWTKIREMKKKRATHQFKTDSLHVSSVIILFAAKITYRQIYICVLHIQIERERQKATWKSKSWNVKSETWTMASSFNSIENGAKRLNFPLRAKHR